MIQFITRNAGWKLLSLAVAFGIWVNVASDPELATIIAVPVEYRNYPKELLISAQTAATVNVEARGPARQIHSLTDLHAGVVIDLASVTGPGDRTFTLTAAQLALPRGVELVRTATPLHGYGALASPATSRGACNQRRGSARVCFWRWRVCGDASSCHSTGFARATWTRSAALSGPSCVTHHLASREATCAPSWTAWW